MFLGQRIGRDARGRGLGTFVSGWFFWFYFGSGKIEKRDMTLARSLDIGDVALIPVGFQSNNAEGGVCDEEFEGTK